MCKCIQIYICWFKSLQLEYYGCHPIEIFFGTQFGFAQMSRSLNQRLDYNFIRDFRTLAARDVCCKTRK